MTRLQIVGGGKMGEALLAGLLSAEWAPISDVRVVEAYPGRRQELAATYPGLEVSDQLAAADGTIVAVKPPDVAVVVGEVVKAGCSRILSIAGGVTIAQLEAAAGANAVVIRSMPNTPAMVGVGASAICASTHVGAEDRAWARELLESVGVVVEVPESQISAVTGLSGSGPAYVFLIAEALVEAGVLNGLARPLAEQLAYQTLLGASTMLTETGTPPAELRAAVTSPGGTTAAGLRALEDNATRAAIIDAVSAAAARSEEMAK